jgi:hypothetical protein
VFIKQIDFCADTQPSNGTEFALLQIFQSDDISDEINFSLGGNGSVKVMHSQ